MKDTQRDLPRALHSSMSIVLVLFVSANLSYFVVLDPAIVASTNTVALDFGRVSIGEIGAVIFSVLVAISCFGAISSVFYTSMVTPYWMNFCSRNPRCPADLLLIERALSARDILSITSLPSNTRSRDGAASWLVLFLRHLRWRLPE